MKTIYNQYVKEFLPVFFRGEVRYMNEVELVCFKMIAALGAARSAFMEAIVQAKRVILKKQVH